MNASPDLDDRFSEFVATGDSGPLGYVFDATADDLYRLALHLCGAPATAEDLVQATWLKAIEGADTFAPGSPVKPWLTGILHNEARMHFRREQVRSRPLVRCAEPTTDPSVEAERKELIEALDAGIADLPEPYGPVVRLHLRHGRTAHAIGEALGRPAGTVRTQLVRGLERLRAILPASLAGVAAALVLPTRGIAAVRSTVLDAATGAKLAAATASGGAAALGTAAVWRAVAIAAFLVVSATATLLWRPRNATAPIPAPIDSRGTDRLVDRAAAPVNDRRPADTAPRNEVAAVGSSASETGTGPTLRLAGRVVDGSGNAIPDPEVFAFRHAPTIEADGSFGGNPLAQTRGDAEGHFELTTDRGRFELFARADGWAQASSIRGAGDTSLAEYDSVEIVVAPAVTVRGRVVGADGRGIADQEVEFGHGYGTSASLRQHHPSILRSGAGTRKTRTDADGNFELRGPAGIGFLTAVDHHHHVRYAERHTFSTAQELRIELQTGDRIGGRVFLHDGRPATGAQVRLDSHTYRRTVADEAGRFSIEGVDLGDSPERGYLSILHAEAATFCLSPIPKRHQDLTIRLQAPRSLVGRVVDEDGRPIEGAKLRVVGMRMVTPNAMHMEPTTWEWAQDVEAATSDAEGRFRFDRLNDGRYTLQAARENLTDGTVETQVSAGETDVVVRIDELATRKAVLLGQVLRAADRQPVANAELRVFPAEGGFVRQGRTDGEGRFEITGFEPGRYSVSASADGLATRHRTMTLTLGDNPYEALLARSVDVTIRVLRTDGAPWSACHVGLESVEGATLFVQVGGLGLSRLNLDTKGEARFTGAPAEPVTLVIEPSDEDAFRVPLDLTRTQDGETLEVRGGTLTPRVRLSLAVSVADGEIGPLDPTTAAGKLRLMGLLRDGTLRAPRRGVHATLFDAAGRELSRGTATPVSWDEVENAEQWQTERAMGFQPFRIESRWPGGSMSTGAMPSPMPGFELRGRAEPMLLRVEAEGFETVEQRIDGASLPPFDEAVPSKPHFVLLRG